MGRISNQFDKLRKYGGKALIPFITAGDPTLDFTKDLAYHLEEMGADLLELGVPFSDPMADGSIIQRASFRSLRNGTSMSDVLRLVEEIREEVHIPLILMTYYNPIFALGEENFIDQAIRTGVDGLIIPDLPYEESGPLMEITKGTGLDVIAMLAPTSTSERKKRYCNGARGFIYYVAQLGVTGVREELPADLKDGLGTVKELTDVPVAAGFGIKTPAQAREVSGSCDGVIVGSALISLMDGAENLDDKLHAAGDFVRALKQAME